MSMIGTKKYTIMVTYGLSSFVPFARMQCLHLDVRRGIKQKPLEGIPYDVWVLTKMFKNGVVGRQALAPKGLRVAKLRVGDAALR